MKIAAAHGMMVIALALAGCRNASTGTTANAVAAGLLAASHEADDPPRIRPARDARHARSLGRNAGEHVRSVVGAGQPRLDDQQRGYRRPPCDLVYRHRAVLPVDASRWPRHLRPVSEHAEQA